MVILIFCKLQKKKKKDKNKQERQRDLVTNLKKNRSCEKMRW